MASISDEYYRFLKQTKGQRIKSESKLYVKEIRGGSIIVELCEKAQQILPGIAPSLVEYSGFLTSTLDYLAGRSSKLFTKYNFLRDDFLNFKKILEPIANFNGNTINFTGINFGRTVVINQSYNSTESNAAQNQCDREIKRLEKAGDSLIRENVKLQLYQARDSKLSKSTQNEYNPIDGIL
jgi:hypothetical protein